MKSSRIVVLSVILVLIASMLVACGSSAPAGVSNLVLSSDKGGASRATFAPPDTISLSADVNQVDAGTSFDIKWYALNVSGQDPATPFVTSTVAYSSGNNLSANINSTTGGFPAGQYKVEVDMNGAKVGEQTFDIQ
jgi:hypothetical protein